MITVDGEPVEDGGDSLRNMQVELKLCKALAMLNPPMDLTMPLSQRIIDLLRAMKRAGGPDPDTRDPASLTDEELREAVMLVRAFRALPSWAKAAQHGSGFRSALGCYALDLIGEMDRRGLGACGDQQRGDNATRGAGLDPDAGLVAGLLGAERCLKVDIAAVDDRHQQDQRVYGLVAHVGDPARRILGLALQLADGAVELADFLAQLEALGAEVLCVQAALDLHLLDVVLDAGQ